MYSRLGSGQKGRRAPPDETSEDGESVKGGTRCGSDAPDPIPPSLHFSIDGKATHSPTNDWDTRAVWVDARRAMTVTHTGATHRTTRQDTQPTWLPHILSELP